MANPSTTKLYAFGSNGSGQLGVGHRDDLTHPQLCYFTSTNPGNDDRKEKEQLTANDDTIAVRRQFLNGESIKKIVAGGNHTLILTKSGQIYTSGNNDDGKCAVSLERECVTEFTGVAWARGREVTDVAATWEASFFVEDERFVWAVGSGARGELGLGEGILRSSELCQVLDTRDLGDGDDKIVCISGSMGNVVVLLSSGVAYGWGSSRKGQLGPALKEERVVWRPKKFRVPFAVTGVALGRDFTYFWSANQEAALFGILNTSKRPTNIRIGRATPQCVAGWSTLYIMEHGIPQGTGEGRRGQLPPPNLPRLTKLSAGSEHCIAVTEDGRVVTWGWGEHGNCGLPTDSRGNVSGHFNMISLATSQHNIAGVGAGCASSFVWTTEQEHE